jgi:MFS family permease
LVYEIIRYLLNLAEFIEFSRAVDSPFSYQPLLQCGKSCINSTAFSSKGPTMNNDLSRSKNSAPVPKPRIFYGWVIVGAGAFSNFVNLGIFQVGLSAFIKDVQASQGWSLSAISLGFSLKQFEQGLLGPLSGYLIDRIGPRIMACIGVLFMTLGLLIFARMESLSSFYLAATVIAIGQGMGAQHAFPAAAVHWFFRKRGKAISILSMGNAWGYTGILGITLLLVLFGWRGAATFSAFIFCGVSLPLALVIRHKPGPYGYLPDGDTVDSDQNGTPSDTHPEVPDSFSVKEAMRSVSFWLVLLCNALYSFTTTVNHVHQIPQLRSQGFSPQGAAYVVAVYGAIQAIARLSSGWIGDKIGRHRVYLVSFILLGAGWITFAYISPDKFWTVPLYFLTYGLGHASYVVSGQAVVADFFGTRRYATIRGVMSSISVLGGVMGPVFAGYMFDIQGDYRLAFLILGPIIAIGAPAILAAGKPTLAPTAR